MDRRLIDYLPPTLQIVRELKGATETEQPEFSAAWDAVEAALNDQFVQSATRNGVARWERILKIVPYATDSMDNRKFRILARLIEQLPYTMRRLMQFLEHLCGPDGYAILLFHERYVLETRIKYLDHYGVRDVLHLLWRVVPANLVVVLRVMIPPALAEEITAGRLRMFRMRAAIYERGNGIIRLDGAERLDGSWVLDAAWGGGPRLEKLRVSLGVHNRENGFVGTRFSGRAGLRTDCQFERLRLGAGAREWGAGRLRANGFMVKSRSGERVGGALTVDSMYYLDGAAGLDGVRKLNAAVIRSELL